MATDVDQAYQEWSQEELSDGDESHEISVSPMLDHGSISFGRFPIESLSWERRSVFTHNRCQEELEKFNGLVAKKKAYFEERYRRIRAMKAQQNQQTELTLDYSGDGSISSQSGEEDGAALQHESQRDGAANIVHPISEEAEHGAAFEWESNCNKPLQERCLDPKSTLPNLTSSREISENTNKNSVDTVLVQPMETESSLPLRGDVKAIESNCGSNLGNKEILQKPENLVSNFDPRRVTHGTALDANKTKLNQLQSCRKSLSYKPLSNVKDSAAVRNGLNVKRETKLNVVQSSKGLKTPSQKMVGQTLSKTTASARSTLVASNGPLTEARSRITTPGPFTFVMERRASNRGSAAKHDSGGSNKLSSSLSHAEGGLSAQKTAATSGITRRREPDIKRDLKEVRNKPLAVDSRYTSLKKMEAHVLGPPNSRSINLPARNKPTSNGGTESQIATAKGTKQKEGNARMREFLRVTAKTTGPSMAGSMRMGTKKATQEADISHTGRTPRLDNLSLDGKKTRRDVPQWRCLKL